METTVQLTDFFKVQSIQIAAVFAIVLILHWLLRHRSAHIRYLLWLLVAVKCMTPPLVSLSVPVLPASSLPTAVAPAGESLAKTWTPNTNENPMLNNTRQSVDSSAPSQILHVVGTAHPTEKQDVGQQKDGRAKAWSINAIIAAGWSVGATLYFLWAIAKSVHLHGRLSALRRPLPAPMAAQIADLAGLWSSESFRGVGSAHAELSAAAPFTVWLAENISQPFVWGLWRGAIYLPVRLQSIETDRQKAVVMHEMAHIVRFDAFVNLLQILVQGIFWFHPLVWIANRFIRAEREKCCDETAVARLGAAPKEYGSAIVDTLLQEYHAGLPIPTLAVAGPVKNIEDRIKTLMQPNKRFYARPTAIATLAILALAILIVPTTVALTHRNTPPDYTLSGMVADVNDKPIAGAIVFDDGYGPQPYQNGTTGADGKFEYKSWNEEHNITAKADGYQQQMMTFTTAPFDNSKKLDFRLELLTHSLPPAIVKEGIGFDDIVVGSEKCTRQYICSRLGEPENKDESWLVYQKQYGLDFWLNPPQKILTEIRLNPGFNGKLTSGISMASTQQQVFEVYGRPVQEKAETNIVRKYGGNRVLLTETIDGEKIGKLYYDDLGLLFWFKNDSINQIMISKKSVISNSSFTATLPNGVTVELVGICEHPSEGKPWWAPDGSPLEQKIITQDHSEYKDNNNAYEVAYRISLPQDVSMDMLPKTKGSTAQSGLTVKSPDGMKAYRTHLDLWGSTTTVSFPIAAGPWKTLGSTNGQGQDNTAVGNRKLMFSPAVGTQEKFALTVSDDLIEFDDFRLVAIDKQGGVHVGNRNWFSIRNMRQNTFTFAGLDPATIERFEFQTRPFENITFKNVSLKPGKKTDVKVETENSSTVSVQPKVETQKSETGIDFIPANLDLQFDLKRGVCFVVVSIPNRGKTVLPKMKLRFYRGDPKVNLDEAGGSQQGWHEAGPIEPDKTWNERTEDFHLTDGQYEFNAILDYDNTVAETDETNNAITLQVKIVNSQIAEKNVSLKPGKKTDVKVETQKSDSSVRLPIENQKPDSHIIGLGSGWSWIQRAVGKHYRGSIGGYSDDQAKCSEYFEEVLSWSKPGDTFFLTFAFDEEQYGHTQLVPEKYRDLLPISWDDLKKQIKQGKPVEAQGQARGLNTMVLAAPTLDQLVELIKTTKLLDPFRAPNAPGQKTDVKIETPTPQSVTQRPEEKPASSP